MKTTPPATQSVRPPRPRPAGTPRFPAPVDQVRLRTGDGREVAVGPRRHVRAIAQALQQLLI